MKTATRHLGFCQICAGEFKLTSDNKMVHHGYKRPGTGEIVGDCYGVQNDPYEVSCELVKVVLKSLTETFLPNLKKSLAQLTAKTRTWFSKTENKGSVWNPILVTTQYVVGVTDLYTLENLYRSATYNTESEIKYMEMDIERLTKRVADWKPMPIRTIEESVVAAKTAADRAARAQEKAAKLAVKTAKAEALKAKRDALQAKRDALVAEFVDSFVQLAKMPESPERKAQAQVLALAKRTNKYSFFYLYEVRNNTAFIDALKTLGLAFYEPSGHLSFSSLLSG